MTKRRQVIIKLSEEEAMEFEVSRAVRQAWKERDTAYELAARVYDPNKLATMHKHQLLANYIRIMERTPTK